jgi:hypothetical protein
MLLSLPDFDEESHEVEQFLYRDVPIPVLVKQVENLGNKRLSSSSIEMFPFPSSSNRLKI